MKQTTGEVNLTSVVIGVIVGALAVIGYLWVFARPTTTPAIEQSALMRERAAAVNDQASLEAANRELDATNLNEVDSELIRIQTQTNY